MSKLYKIALIADELTTACLKHDANIMQVTPYNYKAVLKYFKPDILLVESAWHGFLYSWFQKIASYPHIKNNSLEKVVLYAKERGIRTAFWNKEDAIHFDRFIHSASLFDEIYTVDINAVSLYKKHLQDNRPIYALPFPVQDEIHFPHDKQNIINRCSFVGSYSQHIHPERRMRQNMLFEAAQESGLDIFNRNSRRSNENYLPPRLSENTHIYKRVSHKKTAEIYNKYILNLNVNTIEDSETMYSRRLIEIISCGALALTTPAKSVDTIFKDYCYTVHEKEEAQYIINKTCKDGLSAQQKEMLLAGSNYVRKYFSYSSFLNYIMLEKENISFLNSLNNRGK